MAVLYEGYTLCGLVPSQNSTKSGIQGIEPERDNDHVIVSDAFRSVTLYKVSDQKPLGSWTVKQGSCLTSPAIYNTQTKEYVAVTDNKVIRIWKEDDDLLDKTFKATVSSDIWRVHCVAGEDAVVLFQRGAVRLLDSLLATPQQTVEEVLAPDETIRWSTNIVAETQQFVIFTTEKKGDHFLYLLKVKPNILQKYQLEREDASLSPLSFSASYRDELIHLLYLYPNGHMYQSVISVWGPGRDEDSQTISLPRNLLLALSVDEDRLVAANAVFLDEAHVAVVGVPHPSAGTGKDFLCIWNINFQTLQAGKEIVGKIFGQLWCYSNKIFIPHGKCLSVIPYGCTKSSLASALGKLKQSKTEESRPLVSVPSWNNILHEEKTQSSRTVGTRTLRTSSRSQSSRSLTVEQVLELIKTASVEEVQKIVHRLLSRAAIQDLNQSVGQLASSLVSRSLADAAFYTPSTLAQLVHSQFLCHSMCPDLVQLALEKKDYFLCQLCLHFFPDIPEAVTCTCLKAFISMPDSDAEKVEPEPDSVSFMETLTSREHSQVGLQNGSRSSLEDHSNVTMTTADQENRNATWEELSCPVVLQKAVLLNEVLQMAFSDDLLLPHLKDLSSQHVFIFLQYLHFLYLQYNKETSLLNHTFRAPSVTQIMDWVGLLLDAHFTVLVMTPEAKGLLVNLYNLIKSQVKLYSELGQLEGGLKHLKDLKIEQDKRQYSIEVIEFF
ncbi:nucleolar protein 11-like [Syngnathus acus]|uniref:nucleolar protein 11-like n=1 Tax=Syngnathus acus TaxID=161584 RepID=UPI001885E31D|nr:nucleolar protein 11-like [Syngnathus acus]